VQKLHRGLYNLSVILGLRIGPKLITASALDSMLSSLKVKVRYHQWHVHITSHSIFDEGLSFYIADYEITVKQ